jgi:hypothetical protein
VIAIRHNSLDKDSALGRAIAQLIPFGQLINQDLLFRQGGITMFRAAIEPLGFQKIHLSFWIQ